MTGKMKPALRMRTLRARILRGRGMKWDAIGKKYGVSGAALCQAESKLQRQERAAARAARVQEAAPKPLAAAKPVADAKREPLTCRYQVRRKGRWEPKCRAGAMPCLCQTEEVKT